MTMIMSGSNVEALIRRVGNDRLAHLHDAPENANVE